MVTTIDPKIQGYAARSTSWTRRSAGASYAHGEVVIEPGTGRIKAMAVNRRYSLDQKKNGKHTDRAKREAGLKGNYPNTVNPLLGGGDMAGYQAGSTFKIFTLLAALDEGLPLSTSFNAPPRLRHPTTSPRPARRPAAASTGARRTPASR